MRRLLILLLALLPAASAFGEEPVGTTCDLDAVVDADDAGVIAAYDGLRKGLEIARLPRVCQVETGGTQTGVEKFLERRAMVAAPRRERGLRIDPFFAVGERSCAAVTRASTHLPCVLGVTRYTVQRAPLVPVPRALAGTTVYADLPVEQVATLVQNMLARPDMSAEERARQPAAALFGGHAYDDDPGLTGFARAFGGSLVLSDAMRAAGIASTGAGGYRVPGGDVWAVLCLHVDPRRAAPAFEQALRTSRTHSRPLVSDNRAHFGMGAVVVIVPRHELLGRAMADEGRKLRAGAAPRKTPRVVPGFEIWVDLAAADAIGFELPLSFLARADRIKRGRRAAPRGEVR